MLHISRAVTLPSTLRLGRAHPDEGVKAVGCEDGQGVGAVERTAVKVASTSRTVLETQLRVR